MTTLRATRPHLLCRILGHVWNAYVSQLGEHPAIVRYCVRCDRKDEYLWYRLDGNGSRSERFLPTYDELVAEFAHWPGAWE